MLLTPVRAGLRALALVLLLGAALPLSAQEAPTYGVKPGDELTISFYTSAGDEIDEIAGERTVARDGNIFLPFLGTVEVLGMDAPTIRGFLVELYRPYFENPVIDVEVRLRVSVTGAVGRPGNFFVDPTTTLVDLLAEAGGAQELAVQANARFADASEVRLVRRGQAYILDLRPDGIDPTVVSMRVESGDWLYVPFASRSRWREEVTFWGSVLGLITSVVILFNVT
jgi:protein involved in polysaccharide export with SLBB domain